MSIPQGPNFAPSSNQNGAGAGDGINNPKFDSEGNIINRAVSSASQAYAACTGIINARRTGAKVDAKVEFYYNGGAPMQQSRLVAARQNWRHNIGTGFLSSIIDRRVPSFVTAIESAAHLTMAKLGSGFTDAPKKTAVFRKGFTDLVRSWSGWRDLITITALENLLYGSCMVANTDPMEWRPKVYRRDRGYVPDGTLQDPKNCQALILLEDWTPSEALKKIIDRAEAEGVGWNIENTISCVRDAQPKNPNKTNSAAGEAYGRDYQDLIRETTATSNYESGAKVLDQYQAFFQEADETITQYILRRSDGKEVFCGLNRFESMDDIVQLFTLEPGSGKYYGSKGIGRMILNLHIAAEKARNTLLDMFTVGSLKMIKVAPKDFAKLSRLQFQVATPFAFIGVEGEEMQGPSILNEEFLQAFMSLDGSLVSMAEQIAGAVLPGKGMEGGEKPTATQVEYDAEREAQVRMGTTARWAYQVSRVVSCMQRRVCCEANIKEAQRIFNKTQSIPFRVKASLFAVMNRLGLNMQIENPQIERGFDEEAIDFLLSMLQEGLSGPELYYLGRQPAAKSLVDVQLQLEQQISQFAAKYGATGLLDMDKVMRMEGDATLGKDVMNDIMRKPEQEQTNESEGIRQQQAEIASLMTGSDSVPVSPRDLDLIHMQVVEDRFKQAMQALVTVPSPDGITLAQKAAAHHSAHLEQAKAKKMTPDELQPHALAQQIMQQQIKQATTTLQKAQQQGMVLPPQ